MIEKSSPLKQRIIDCLKVSYGIEVATLALLPLGADMQASVYKAQTHNQSSYFVKLRRGHQQDVSAIIVELLGNAGIQEVIPFVKTLSGQATQCIDDFTISVSLFVDGRDGFSQELTDNQWYTLGKVMRQLHEIKVPHPVQAKIRREAYSPKWREAVQLLYPLIESEPNMDEASAKLLEFMKKNMATIHRLVSRSEQLTQRVQDQPYEFVLCHADIHGGNVLIDERDAIYIVDWDDPVMAPKERDLMFIGGGVANVWNKLHEGELFYKGYGATEVNATLLAYYRHERILEDIALYGQQLLLTMEGGQERVKLYDQFISQFESGGVVEIALNSKII